MGSLILTGERHPFDSSSINKLVYRGKYYYYDFSVSYFLLKCKNHDIQFLAGLSLAHGNNSYLKRLVLAPPPPDGQGDVIDVEYYAKASSYFGALAGLAYNFSFWKKRITVGPDVMFRWYNQDFPFQLNYGLHAGYHF